MSLAHLYREFGLGRDDGLKLPAVSQEAIEDLKLEAFEKGYSAGWDDSLKAKSKSETDAAADFVNALQDISFGFFEARSGLVKAMQPLLSDIVTKLLPEIARASLATHIIEQATDMMRQSADQTIRIEANQSNIEALSEMSSEGVPVPFVLVPNSGLATHQVLLQVSQEEREIDLDTVLIGIDQAMAAFVQQIQQESKND